MAKLFLVHLKSVDGEMEIHIEPEATSADDARSRVEGWKWEKEEIIKIESVEMDDVEWRRFSLLCQVIDNISALQEECGHKSPEEMLLFGIFNREKTVDALMVTSTLPTLLAKLFGKI